jgi:hypothetical protein
MAQISLPAMQRAGLATLSAPVRMVYSSEGDGTPKAEAGGVATRNRARPLAPPVLGRFSLRIVTLIERTPVRKLFDTSGICPAIGTQGHKTLHPGSN